MYNIYRVHIYYIYVGGKWLYVLLIYLKYNSVIFLYIYIYVYFFTVVGPGRLNRWYDSGYDSGV